MQSLYIQWGCLNCLWAVRRWLRLLPIEELEREVEWRRMVKLFDEACEKLSVGMLDNYFINSKPLQEEMLGGNFTDLGLNWVKDFADSAAPKKEKK